METLTGKILGVSANAGYFLDNLRLNFNPPLIVDVIIVAVLFYWVYIFLRETRAMRILYGLIFLLILMAIGKLFDLVLLNWILQSLMAMLVVAIPVVFQPELRAGLEKLGKANLLGEGIFSKDRHKEIINEVINAVIILSQQKTGALIVLQRHDGLREFIDNGRKLDAVASSDLIRSIFFPKSPLHDGAVIIIDGKIVSASSILPVSQATISSNLGTRHKAALGVTENTDAVSIVVSEETGAISLAIGGKLDYRVTEERLKNRLSALLSRKNK